MFVVWLKWNSFEYGILIFFFKINLKTTLFPWIFIFSGETRRFIFTRPRPSSVCRAYEDGCKFMNREASFYLQPKSLIAIKRNRNPDWVSEIKNSRKKFEKVSTLSKQALKCLPTTKLTTALKFSGRQQMVNVAFAVLRKANMNRNKLRILNTPLHNIKK